MGQTCDKPLELKQEQMGQAVVVHICGSVTIRDAETLAAALEALAARKVPLMVLDLSEMDFICSTGLGAIISGYLKCRRHNGEVRLVGPQPAVREMLETTRLTKLFPLYVGIAQALDD